MKTNTFSIAAFTAAAITLSACDDTPSQQTTQNESPQKTESASTGGDFIQAAIQDAARPEADKQRDANRKPAEVMAYAGFKPGDIVADIGSSGGYYTRIVSKIVGPSGQVFAFNPQEVVDSFFKEGNPADALAAEYENVTSVVSPFSTPTFSEPLDGAMIVLFYHDSHWEKLGTDTASLNKTILDQLKPGGTYLIIDHHAPEGTGLRDVGTTHRIDAALVKQEVIDAGFEFVGESDLLSHPEEDRTKSVFDPSVRGKTDRFIYKFKKPE